jgi:molybdate transport system ATP-binding protein
LTVSTTAKTAGKRFLTFQDVTLRIRDRHVFQSTRWQIECGQNWAVLGPNGSGKSTLVRAIVAKTPVVGGSIQRHHTASQADAMGYVSFERLQDVVAGEQAKDEARYFSGRLDSRLTVRQFMDTTRKSPDPVSATAKQAVSLLDLERLMARPLNSLSNGEMRRVLISKAASETRRLLILDEPFDGLDAAAADALRAAIQIFIHSGIQIILISHRLEEILPDITHVICLKDCRVVFAGLREQVLTQENLKRVYGTVPEKKIDRTNTVFSRPTRDISDSQVVIEVKNASLRYGKQTVFKHLNWRVRKGENWAISGPNGSGKTSLMQMVTGEHLQAYANEIYLFGQRRGSGESVQEIKQRIGVCSAEFQLNYRKPIRGLEVVLSGFFNSIGLYRQADRNQRKSAEQCLRRLNLSHLREKRFDHLSYGERRALLLARVMVKSPAILALDEPCQGLDPLNRDKILVLLEDICHNSDTQFLMITHHPGDLPRCITHRLDMQTGSITVGQAISEQ